MKKLMKFAVIGFLALGLASCELFNVDVDTTLSGYLDIAVTDDGVKKASGPYEFGDDVTFYPRDNEDVDEYADKIVDVIVNDIILRVESVSETGVVIYDGSYITVSQGTEEIQMFVHDDWTVTEGDAVTIDNMDGAYGEVEDILRGLDPFNVSYSGFCSHTGVTFTLRLDMETTVTGNPF